MQLAVCGLKYSPLGIQRSRVVKGLIEFDSMCRYCTLCSADVLSEILLLGRYTKATLGSKFTKVLNRLPYILVVSHERFLLLYSKYFAGP